MNIPEESIGNYPNVAIEAGNNPAEVMREHGVKPPFGPSEGPSSTNMDSDADKAWNKAWKLTTDPIGLMRELRGYATDARYWFDIDSGRFRVDENLPKLSERIEEALEKAIEIRDEAIGDAARFKHERDSLQSLYDESIEINEAIANERERAFFERDEWKRKADDAYMRGLMAGRASLDDEFSELITDRDEWKAKAEMLQEDADNIGSACDKLRLQMSDLRYENGELQKDVWAIESAGEAKDMQSAALEAERDYWREQVQLCMDSAYPPNHSPEQRYAPGVMAYPDREGCTTPSTMVSAVIDGLRDEKAEQYMGLLKECESLIAERDEWKAKAEGFTEALEKLGCSVLANGTVFEGSSKVRAGSSKRAAAVERLREMPVRIPKYTYPDFVSAITGFEHNGCHTMTDVRNALIDLLEDETMDAGLDDDGTCPIDDWTSPNDRATEHVTNFEWLYLHDREKLLDLASTNIGCYTIFDCPDLVNGECANSDPSLLSCYKHLREWLMAPHVDAHSKTGQNLSEQPEALSDDKIQESLISDSREKLEADVLEFSRVYYANHLLVYDKVIELLDRQAAITEREHPGLTISDDESLINWHGKNYLLQSRVLNAERERDEFSLKLKHEMELNRDNRNAHDLERIQELEHERDKAKARVAELESTISALKELLLEVPVDSIAASKLEGGL